MGNCFNTEKQPNEPSTKPSAKPSVKRKASKLKRQVTEEEKSEFFKFALKAQEETRRQLKDDFKNNPEIFVLNNLLMTTQFFTNYKK